jgi:DNA-directed RNA polymerase II subunit RPB2
MKGRSVFMPSVTIAQIPVMIGSVISPLTTEEYGGYFVINGIDRVIVSQIRQLYNHPLVISDSDGTLILKVRSMSSETQHSVAIECKLTPEGLLTINVPYTTKSINARILFELINVHTFRDAYQLIGVVSPKWATVLFRLFHEPLSDNPYVILGKLASKYQPSPDWIALGQQLFEIDMFPHLGSCATFEQRKEYLVLLFRKLALVWSGQRNVDDRDNLMFKRTESAGILLNDLFRGLFKYSMISVRDSIAKNTSWRDVINKLNHTITKHLKTCMAKGKWGLPKNTYARQGVCQPLNRLSHLASLSHLQRLMIPMGKEGKHVEIRQIHPSQFGFICLYETPEGAPCGIVLNTTILTKITSNCVFHTIDLFKETTGQYCVFLNDIPWGRTNDLEAYTKRIRMLRLNRQIPYDVSVYFDRQLQSVFIYCDRGRFIRPVLQSQTDNRVWLDTSEIQHTTVAMTKEEAGEYYEYYEIHPSVIFGICAGSIPFSDHNQSPRNVYESCMMKQALGWFSNDVQTRTDTAFYTLCYPQAALMTTVIGRVAGMHEFPAGANCVVAICTMEGWNAEDSIVINKMALERGLFASYTFKTVSIDEHSSRDDTLRKFKCVPLEYRQPKLNYDALDENGIVRIGTTIQKGDVLVGCVEDTNGVLSDCSEIADEEGIVDRIVYHPEKRVLKIVLRSLNLTEVGDKFANLCAQKGTCGRICESEDMPFTLEGMIPDVLVNPNAIPSRMTISMLFEMAMGKQCVHNGVFGDATPFEHSGYEIDIEDARKEYLYSGQTGERFKSQIFVGTSYYQKLKHMVGDKMHARSYGNVTTLTRQPNAGRSKDGGLRFGEMERDSVLSHGCSCFLKEKMFDQSDEFTVRICNNCEHIINYDTECHRCRSNEIIETNLPYAGKLLFQQLEACLIHSKFKAVYC